ncbi:MAG: hypothetical protein CVU90_04190 [Firmicutes bacterium HGW-Firmicutes-15]|nr:MAG: hypothetical protein CVU90_04190 [Firmicutes bacterium HGW-Firmicutes-15]
MKSYLTGIFSKGFRNKRVKMIVLLLAAALVVAFALTTYAKDNASNDDPTQFINVTRGDIAEKVSASGTVNAPTRVKLNFAPGSSGKLTLMRAKVGDVVKSGDVLATLDDRTAQTQLANAQANLDSALAKLNQTKQGATTETAALQQSNVEKARVAWEGAKTAYENQLAIFNDRTQAYQPVTNAENQVVQAQIQLRSAQAGLYSAEARLDAASMGASNESLEVARASLQAAESQYDMAFIKYTAAQETAEVDQAKASLDQAQIALSNAKKQLADLEALPIPSNVVQAEAAVTQAQAAVDQAANSYSAAQDNLEIARAVYNNRTQAQTQLDQVKNQMDQAQATYNSTVAQMNQALAPAARESIQMAEATLAQARIQVQQQKIALDNLLLRAPMDGVITQVNGNEGELVSASLPVVEINDSNTNVMHVMAEVSQNDIVKLRSAQPAEFTTTALLDQAFTGQVLVVYPEATTQNGITKYTVLLSAENPGGVLKAGLTVNVAIEVGSQSNVLYVPIQALRQLNGTDGVYIADSSQKTKGALRFQPVTIGLFGGDIVEITSGLQEGDQVAVSNLEDSSSSGMPSMFGG